MGLDGVELVMEVEETFGISVTDTEAQELRTVGDLYALVVEKQRDLGDSFERESLCASASAFYALRRGATTALALDRELIHPTASTAALLGPYLGRHGRWASLQSASGLRLPALRWPVGLLPTLVLASLALGLWAGWWVDRGSGKVGDAITAVILVSVGMAFLLVLLARPFARHLPRSCGTVRGLIGVIVPRNLGTLTVQLGRRPTDDEVFESLRRIIVELLGVKPEVVTPEARFVEDLGLG